MSMLKQTKNRGPVNPDKPQLVKDLGIPPIYAPKPTTAKKQKKGIGTSFYDSTNGTVKI